MGPGAARPAPKDALSGLSGTWRNVLIGLCLRPRFVPLLLRGGESCQGQGCYGRQAELGSGKEDGSCAEACRTGGEGSPGEGGGSEEAAGAARQRAETTATAASAAAAAARKLATSHQAPEAFKRAAAVKTPAAATVAERPAAATAEAADSNQRLPPIGPASEPPTPALNNEPMT